MPPAWSQSVLVVPSPGNMGARWSCTARALEVLRLICPGNRLLPEGWLAGCCASNHICHIFLKYVLYVSSNRGVGGRLTLSGLQYEDQGEYTCLAENSVGRERSPPVSLAVIGPPRVALAHIGGVQLLEGGDAVLEVEWCAAPFPRQVLTKIKLLRAHNLPLEMKGCL